MMAAQVAGKTSWSGWTGSADAAGQLLDGLSLVPEFLAI